MVAIPAGSHGIVYARVSTEHQAQEELPIDSQVSTLTAAVTTAGATCEVVTDAGISGTDFDARPGFQSIISRGRSAKPDFAWVLVWKMSRFGRGMEDSLIARGLLRRRGIEVMSFSEPVPEGPTGELLTHMLMAVDEFYAAATAADVLRSQRELARQGYSAGGRPPVGYMRAPEVIGTKRDGSARTRVRWVPDPETAPRVARAFAMAAAGEPYGAIVDETRICRNKSSLATILANPMYRGVKVFARERRAPGEHGRKRLRNLEEAQVESPVEPIVDEETWGRVAAMLQSRRENRLPPQRLAHGYLLSDILRCACGSKMTGAGNGSVRYYRCVAKCGRPYVRTDAAEKAVGDLIRDQLLTEASVRQMLMEVNAAIAERTRHRSGDLRMAEAAVRKAERDEAGLKAALRQAQESSPGAVGSVLAELVVVAEERRAAEDAVRTLHGRERPIGVTERAVRETLAGMGSVLDHAPFESRVATIRDLFASMVADGNTLTLTWAGGDVARSDVESVWLRR